MNQNLMVAAKRLENWMVQKALPFWSTRGINPVFGNSVERFSADGEVDTQANIRMLVQSRQIFAFAAANQMGWLENGEKVVAGIVDFIAKFGRQPSGEGYVHALAADHSVINPKLDLYDHAFFLLACAWRYRTLGDPQALAEAEATITLLDRSFAHHCGGWSEGDYVTHRRRQNPHMHLFEAFMALFAATGQQQWLTRAEQMFNLFQTHFFDSQNNVLLEFFNEDWTPLNNSEGEIVEPGHMMEWVWLLRWYESLTGQDISYYADAMYSRAAEIGIAPTGVLYDEVNRYGEIIKATKRCWPMTEYIKASIMQARAGVKSREENAANGINALMKYYLTASSPGAYIDQLDESDQVRIAVAPASTLYHLVGACIEVSRYLHDKP